MSDPITLVKRTIKRKAEEEYSTNLHTVKARKRMESISPKKKLIENRKGVDTSTVKYAKRKLKATLAYISATPA